MSAAAVPDKPINAELTEREVLALESLSWMVEMTAGFRWFGFTLRKAET